VQPHEAGCSDDIIGSRILKTGDVFPDRAPEELDILGKVAKITVSTGRQPDRHVGPVQTHMPRGGVGGAGDETPESGLAGA
jgi:hypothetical protein